MKLDKVISLRVIARLIADYVAVTPKTTHSSFVDWLSATPILAGWTRRDVYQACLGRLPEPELATNAAFTGWNYASPLERAEHIIECLLCDEFRANFVDIVGKAYPEAQRVFFVHIPRTGGTSTERAIEKASGTLLWYSSFTTFAWLEVESSKRGVNALGYILRLIGNFAYRTPRLYVTGHFRLADIFFRGWVRAGDIVFSIIREPLEVCISALNYIIDTVRRNSGRPDSVDWRALLNDLGCSSIYEGGAQPDHFKILLRSQRFVDDYANLTTRMLSLDGTVEGAIRLLDLTQCDIITLSMLDQWVKVRLDLDIDITKEHRNASSRSTDNLLQSQDYDFVRDKICRLDNKLFDILIASTWGPTGSVDLVAPTY